MLSLLAEEQTLRKLNCGSSRGRRRVCARWRKIIFNEQPHLSRPRASLSPKEAALSRVRYHPIMDVRATATFISNYFMVIEWGKTQVDVVERALRSANDVRESVLGVILNKVEIEKMHKYDVYSKSYYT